jgi:hypothetical protein
MNRLSPNKAAAPNRRPALRFEGAGFIGSWIRCQSPVPAAVGELVRWAEKPRVVCKRW